MPFFHAFTGCDTVSNFWRIGKKTAAETDIWETFKFLSNIPKDVPISCFQLIQRFVVQMYDNNSDRYSVNAARRKLVGEGRTVDRIPPTENALKEHIKRAVYQAGYVWAQSLETHMSLPEATLWGWKHDNDGELTPVWTELPEVAKACRELIRCGCLKGCKAQCKCKSNNIPCCELCKCEGQCT